MAGKLSKERPTLRCLFCGVPKCEAAPVAYGWVSDGDRGDQVEVALCGGHKYLLEEKVISNPPCMRAAKMICRQYEKYLLAENMGNQDEDCTIQTISAILKEIYGQ